MREGGPRGARVLETQMRVRRSRPEVFAFFADAFNLERITPPALRFRILTPGPIALQRGSRILYRLRLRGVPFTWETLISGWDPPARFVDSQLRGPYRRWVHTHEFEEDGDATVVRDRVEYALPLWPLAEWAHPWVRRELDHIFAHRQAAIRALLEGAGGGR